MTDISTFCEMKIGSRGSWLWLESVALRALVVGALALGDQGSLAIFICSHRRSVNLNIVNASKIVYFLFS